MERKVTAAALTTAVIFVATLGTTIVTMATIMNHYAYANHNVINRGECQRFFEDQGLSKKQAHELCSNPDIIIYGGRHCVSYLEQFGFSRDAAHDICQAFFTHKFNKSNP
jgi:hypothetical protein